MIVGGSDGLGIEIVREVFKKGALITIIGRDKGKLLAIKEELDNNHQGNPLIRIHAHDISTMESFEVEKLLKKSEKYFGAIEMFIFCPALSEPVMFLSSDLAKFRNHMDLTFFCAVKFIIPISKRMVLRKTRGRICLIGDSAATHHTIPGMTPYACSKAALEQLAIQLRSELTVHGIQVHYFIPPPMKTIFYERQVGVYPLVTRELLKNTRTVST